MRAIWLVALALLLAGCSDDPTDEPAETTEDPEEPEVMEPQVRDPKTEGATADCDLVAAGVREGQVNLNTGENVDSCTVSLDTLDSTDPLPYRSAVVSWEWSAGDPTLQSIDLSVEITGNGNTTTVELSGDPGGDGSSGAAVVLLPIEGAATVTFDFVWTGATSGFEASAQATLYELETAPAA